MALLIALIGATVLLSGLVLVVGFLRRGEEPPNYAAGTFREPSPVGASSSGDSWLFGGAGGRS